MSWEGNAKAQGGLEAQGHLTGPSTSDASVGDPATLRTELKTSDGAGHFSRHEIQQFQGNICLLLSAVFPVPT